MTQLKSYGQFSIGDMLHIQRWYFAENGPDFHTMGNCIMVDVVHPITQIHQWDCGFVSLVCGKFSTTPTDVANKGKILPELKI